MKITSKIIFFATIALMSVAGAAVVAKDNGSPIKTPLLNGKPDFTGVWQRQGPGLRPKIDEKGSSRVLLFAAS